MAARWTASALADYCGDGTVNGPEICDDGSYDGCEANCDALGPYCGDSVLNDNDIPGVGYTTFDMVERAASEPFRMQRAREEASNNSMV